MGSLQTGRAASVAGAESDIPFGAGGVITRVKSSAGCMPRCFDRNRVACWRLGAYAKSRGREDDPWVAHRVMRGT